MIFLDTHAIIWLHEEEFSKFTNSTLQLMESSPLYFSPISKVEIHYLNQKEIIKKPAIKLLEDMKDRIGLIESHYSYKEITKRAINISWTRDPFDLLISSEVYNQENHSLVTRDENILQNLKEAIW